MLTEEQSEQRLSEAIEDSHHSMVEERTLSLNTVHRKTLNTGMYSMLAEEQYRQFI